jgi:hypothetical protein
MAVAFFCQWIMVFYSLLLKGKRREVRITKENQGGKNK